MNYVRSMMLAGLVISSPVDAIDRPLTCYVETPSPDASKLARQKLQAAGIERKLQRLINQLRADLKAGEGDAKLQELLARAEVQVKTMKDIQAREYCPTGSSAAAAFIEEVVFRIEECGSRNFPTVNGSKIYGTADAEYVLDAKGDLVSANISKTSGSQALDEHVLRLVAASAPFPGVPGTLTVSKYQQLVFRNRFNFVHLPDGTVREPKLRCRM